MVCSFKGQVLARYLERMGVSWGDSHDGELADALNVLRQFSLERLEYVEFDQCGMAKPI